MNATSKPGMMALPSMEKNDSSGRGALLFCLFELTLFIYLRKATRAFFIVSEQKLTTSTAW